MNVLAAILWGLVGIPVGAFLNVVVERTPERLRLRGMAADRDVPALAWLGVPVQPYLLRGRRPSHPLPRRWLAVEAATVVVFVALGGRFGDDLAIAPMLVLGAALVAVTFVDLEHLRIPDRVTFPALGLALPLVLLVSADHDVTDAVPAALFGSLAFFVLLLVPHLVYPRGMGFGDVKLALLLGLFLGWVGWEPTDGLGRALALVLYALVLGCILGAVFGLVHAAVTKRRGEFPFGPALALGCLVILLVADAPHLT